MKNFWLSVIAFCCVAFVFFIGVKVGETTTLMSVQEKLDDIENNKEVVGGNVISQSPNTVIKADNGDIANVSFSYAEDYRSVTITFLSGENIDDLKMEVKLKDSAGTLLDTQIIAVGDTVDGKLYSITATLPNNSTTQGKVIKTTEMNVYSGTLKD